MTPERELFWRIGAGWLFYVLAAVAMALLVAGVVIHVKVWLKSAPKGKAAFSGPALKQTIMEVLLGGRMRSTRVGWQRSLSMEYIHMMWRKYWTKMVSP